jgi:GTPase SAR1 family protein
MANRQFVASLSKGRTGWCVIFRHPVALASDGKQHLRVRRGLATRDEGEAARLVGQLNEILADSTYWSPGARSRAAAKFSELVVSAFFDHLLPESRNGWAEREQILPLPSKEDGYAKVQLVGTTGAGKTTVVRQLLGTDPSKERFPSTSAAKTTVSDLEIIVGGNRFSAAVSFITREQARHYVMECISASVSAHLENNQPSEISRRFMEHAEQKFRLSYVLGSANLPKSNVGDSVLDDEDDEDEEEAEADSIEVTSEERELFAQTIREFLQQISALAAGSRESFFKAARDFGIDLARVTPQKRDVLQDLVEEGLQSNETFHELADQVLEEVESRFDFITSGELVRSKDGWPILWTINSDEREEFIRAVNRFSSNYAPNFGRLLTPLVEGIRVKGPFIPKWSDGKSPKIVLLDGQGIGHTADSTSSISTSVTKRFQMSDAIILVDNAAQPMQAAPMSVLRTLVASGHESKLILAFTHFDEVKGDNLADSDARKEHVIGSFFNAVQAIGKSSGREAEHALKRLHPDRLVFLASIQAPLKAKAKFTTYEFNRMLAAIEDSIAPQVPATYQPVYDVANLVLAIQKATQEFHERWKGIFGMGCRSNTVPEHWTRVKALTRQVGVFKRDEYDTLRPIADLILRLQERVSSFLAEPLSWSPALPADGAEELRVQAVDTIRREVNQRLHELSRRRMIDERLSGWVEAFELKGTGSTRTRAKDLLGLYESAAPVPNEMPGPDSNEFLFELRELVADSIEAGGGKLRGWKREST